MMSYLQLLVNSRDELALARVINTPDRELGVRKFTKIKRLAREKNMSMYQVWKNWRKLLGNIFNCYILLS